MQRAAHLRFVVFDPHTHTFRGAPAGLTVELVDDRTLRRDRVVARATSAEDGRVDVVFDVDGTPDLYLRVQVPEGTPRHIDPERWTWSRRGPGVISVPRTWTSTHHTAVERPNRLGDWDDWAGTRIGRPDSPVPFELTRSRPRMLAGNRATALIDGPETLARLEALIRSARHSIHIEMMLWFDDAIGRRITDRLVEAGQRGVDVRVLLDRETTEGTHTLTALHATWVRFLRTVDEPEKSALLAQVEADVEAEKARGDLSTIVRRLRQADHVQLRITSFPRVFVRTAPDGPLPAAYAELARDRPWFNVARIDHRKLLVIDGHTAITGGMNIGREYLHDTPFLPDRPAADEPFHKWHDVMVELSGPTVRPLQHLFRERWMAEGGPHFGIGRDDDPHHPTFPALPPHPDGVDVRIVSTTPGARADIERSFLGLIRHARRELLISTPYFSSEAAREAILATARRGVRVVLVLPDDHNDSVDFRYAARMHYAALIEAGVEVYEYRHRMNHSKVFISDDVSVIGSANLNRTSFENHYEVAAIIRDAAFTRDFRRRLFEVDLPRSRRIRPADLDALLDLNAVGRWWCRALVNRFF